MSNVLLLGLSDILTDEQVESVRQAAGDREVLHTQDEDKIASVIDRIEIVAGTLPENLLARASSLRWYQLWSAGADWVVDNEDAQRMDFVLTNASGVHAIPISEHIFSFLLAFARDLPRSLRAQDQHEWVETEKEPADADHEAGGPDDDEIAERSQYDTFELAGKTVAIVGLGAIGARAAKLAAAMEMRVIGIRRDTSESVPGVDKLVAPDELHTILPDVDFLVNTTPLTPETEDMFDAQVFSAMPDTAYFINIGRGGSVVEADLIDALQNGEIAGAGLDVFDKEPLSPDSPLWELSNVILTSHASGVTPRYDERALAIFLDNLERYERGEELKNVVDKSLGY